jgi:hypothetical protein
MSMEDHRLPEEVSSDDPPARSPQGRGYFFHIAIFFILIALLCYLVGSTRVNWFGGIPAPPTAATSSTTSP